jgi:hypothetical protein
MSFHPNIPQSSDDPKDSQLELLQNFGKLNTDFSINHVALTQIQNAGYHTKIQFPSALGSNPNLSSPQASLYIKTVSGLSQLFFQNGSAAANALQMTNLPVTTSGTKYTVFTPWRIRLQMGSATSSPVSFPANFAGGFTLLTALISNVTGTNAKVGTVSTNQFTYTSTGGNEIRYFIMAKE